MLVYLLSCITQFSQNFVRVLAKRRRVARRCRALPLELCGGFDAPDLAHGGMITDVDGLIRGILRVVNDLSVVHTFGSGDIVFIQCEHKWCG